MSNILLEVRNLHASVDGKEILKGVNLTINEGEVHAIMGPNGSGKSTFSGVLAGNPAYTVTEGEAKLHGVDLLNLPLRTAVTKDSSFRSNTRWKSPAYQW